MFTELIDTVTGGMAAKRRYREYRTSVEALPVGYRDTIEALQRYLTHLGPGDGEHTVAMLEALGDLFQENAADGVPVRRIVGDDPVAFAETFLRNYPEGQWLDRERRLLRDAVDRAAQCDT